MGTEFEWLWKMALPIGVLDMKKRRVTDFISVAEVFLEIHIQKIVLYIQP